MHSHFEFRAQDTGPALSFPSAFPLSHTNLKDTVEELGYFFFKSNEKP